MLNSTIRQQKSWISWVLSRDRQGRLLHKVLSLHPLCFLYSFYYTLRSWIKKFCHSKVQSFLLFSLAFRFYDWRVSRFKIFMSIPFDGPFIYLFSFRFLHRLDCWVWKHLKNLLRFTMEILRRFFRFEFIKISCQRFSQVLWSLPFVQKGGFVNWDEISRFISVFKTNFPRFSRWGYFFIYCLLFALLTF